MSSIRLRDQSPVGLNWAYGFAQHDLEVKRKYISKALLGGLYRNCTRAMLCNQLPPFSPQSPDRRSDLPERIAVAGSSTKPVLWSQETLREDGATAGPGSCCLH